jgi:hypothetical protein
MLLMAACPRKGVEMIPVTEVLLVATPFVAERIGRLLKTTPLLRDPMQSSEHISRNSLPQVTRDPESTR